MPNKTKYVQIAGINATIDACKVAVKAVVGGEIKLGEVSSTIIDIDVMT